VADRTTHQHAPAARIALTAIGVVFGDIGTSPLYTLRECTSAPHGVPPTPANVLGLLSLVFWTLTMVVSVKYVGVIMQADNQGEGGIFALLALLPEPARRTAKVGWVTLLVILGASFIIGDGMITPAISVLSAIEGLEVAAPPLARVVVPLTCAVLFALFAIQKKGTGRVGSAFGPVMVIWFVVIGSLGAWHIAKNPQVLAALSPVHAVRFFAAHGLRGALVLGGVVLAVTGGEALYADMGHFGRPPIRLSWFALVMPALVLNYFGQGALLLHASSVAHPFFSMVAPGLLTYAMVALASAATVIASQALISGAFSLVHQAVQLGIFPRVTICHTSSEAEGQIYIPEVNWGLMIASLALVIGFRESNRLAAAYGIAVTGTMAITSIVFFEVTRKRWRWPVYRSVPLLLLFLSFDIPFFVANLFKIVDGGYVPIVVGILLSLVMVTWKNGRREYVERTELASPPIEVVLRTLEQTCPVRVPIPGMYLTTNRVGVPRIIHDQIARMRCLPEVLVLLTIEILHVPYVGDDNLVFEDLGKGFRRLKVCFGFMDKSDVPRALERAVAKFDLPVNLGDVTYYVGRATFLATSEGRMGKWSEGLFAFLSRNTTPITAQFHVPVDQVIELGSEVDL
jgi:KUP system potassium uptake protein